MRALLICYVLGVLALNFRLDDPVFFYLALTAFPVTIYLTVSGSGKNKKEKTQLPVDRHDEKKKVSVDASFDLDNSSSR